MTIGIIGAGAIGSAIARALARHHIPAMIANSRGPETLAALVEEIGPTLTAVTREQAAQADMVFLAVNWATLPQALAGLPAWQNRIVIDANNAVEVPSFRAVPLGGRTSSEVVSDHLPGARLVKAFNHLSAPLLSEPPESHGGQRVLFYAGDDADAKQQVAALMAQLGFAGLDLGALAAGGALFQFPGGPLAVHHLVKQG